MSSDDSETDEKGVIMKPSWWRPTDPHVGVSASSTESPILKKNWHGVDDFKLSFTPANDDVHFESELL